MPPDINEKEKIVGGILTLGQVGWIAIGAACCLTTGLLLKLMDFGWFGFIVGIPFIIQGFRFALVKKEDLTLFKYYKVKAGFKRKTKYLPNTRDINISDVEVIVKKETTGL